MSIFRKTWPGGRLWVFQGTIAEDATAGTHVCSLTVTPGVGGEIQFLYGMIKEGNTATAQTMAAVISDGTNDVLDFLFITDTAANVQRSLPPLVNPVANTNSFPALPSTGFIVSGAQQLIFRVTTAAVSVTQTFAMVCRVKGDIPTATLLDTIGTSTNTVNTNAIFG